MSDMLKDISIPFRSISGNSPEAGWFPHSVGSLSAGSRTVLLGKLEAPERDHLFFSGSSRTSWSCLSVFGLELSTSSRCLFIPESWCVRESVMASILLISSAFCWRSSFRCWLRCWAQNSLFSSSSYFFCSHCNYLFQSSCCLLIFSFSL